jgi:hypothetical protein
MNSTIVTLSSPDGRSVSTSDEAIVKLVRGLMTTEVALIAGHDEGQERRHAWAAQHRSEAVEAAI